MQTGVENMLALRAPEVHHALLTGRDSAVLARTVMNALVHDEIVQLIHDKYVVNGFVNGMVASHLLCHSGTINRHSLNGALLS